jgi:hypothetical protein
MRLSHSLSKDSWIFCIEQEINPGKLTVLTIVIPFADVATVLTLVALNQDWAPMTFVVFWISP